MNDLAAAEVWSIYIDAYTYTVVHERADEINGVHDRYVVDVVDTLDDARALVPEGCIRHDPESTDPDRLIESWCNHWSCR